MEGTIIMRSISCYEELQNLTKIKTSKPEREIELMKNAI